MTKDLSSPDRYALACIAASSLTPNKARLQTSTLCDPLMPLTLEQLTVKTGAYQAPALSTHGYIVQPSGVVYALTQRYIHGLVLALLYPDRL